MEILIDGVKYTEDVFIITHSQLGWNRYLEFQSLRFYERSWDIPSFNNYRYGTYFPQSVARCIFFELYVSSSYKALYQHSCHQGQSSRAPT